MLSGLSEGHVSARSMGQLSIGNISLLSSDISRLPLGNHVTILVWICLLTHVVALDCSPSYLGRTIA